MVLDPDPREPLPSAGCVRAQRFTRVAKKKQYCEDHVASNLPRGEESLLPCASYLGHGRCFDVVVFSTLFPDLNLGPYEHRSTMRALARQDPFFMLLQHPHKWQLEGSSHRRLLVSYARILSVPCFHARANARPHIVKTARFAWGCGARTMNLQGVFDSFSNVVAP